MVILRVRAQVVVGRGGGVKSVARGFDNCGGDARRWRGWVARGQDIGDEGQKIKVCGKRGRREVLG